MKIGEIVPVDKYVIFRFSDENRHTIREVFDLNDDISHIEFDSVLGQIIQTEVVNDNQNSHRITYYPIDDFSLQLSRSIIEQDGDKCICFKIEQLHTTTTPFQFLPPTASEVYTTHNPEIQYGTFVNHVPDHESSTRQIFRRIGNQISVNSHSCPP